MNRSLFVAAFLLGATAVIWMGSTFVGSDKLALTVIVVIGCVYTLGFAELLQFRRATTTLAQALSDTVAAPGEKITELERWLQRVHPSLRNAVRLRIEGERIGLPAPVITPYLVGLLVMLGLLGTFVGMVDTLKGAVFALEGTTELQAIRAGLAAPINGLSLAFGTSVAGVAASAMLGLIATLSRRDRILATRQLDSKIASTFRDFSLTYNRQETYKSLQMQAQVLPDVAQTLHQLAEKLERMGDTLGDRLISNQNQFHEAVKCAYSDLATSVDQSLRQSLSDSGRQAGESIKPLVTAAMAGISEEAKNTQQELSATAQSIAPLVMTAMASFSEEAKNTQQELSATAQSIAPLVMTAMSGISEEAKNTQQELSAAAQSIAPLVMTAMSGISEEAKNTQQELSAAAQSIAPIVMEAMAGISEEAKNTQRQLSATAQEQLQEFGGQFARGTGALLASFDQSSNSWGDRIDQLTATMGTQLGTLRQEEEHRGQASLERMAGLEGVVAEHLATLGQALEQPMTRLIETASETPRAAAEVIEHLRREISNNIERDNSLLQERTRTMEQLSTLSESLAQSSAAQRDALEQMTTTSVGMLREVSAKFGNQVGSELSKVTEMAEHFASSASEMSSLGDSFSTAVSLFNESNHQLIENLARVEESMDRSTSRSDEQMGYYVAQAREIIDQTMQSQKEVFEQLQQLNRQGDLLPAEAS